MIYVTYQRLVLETLCLGNYPPIFYLFRKCIYKIGHHFLNICLKEPICLLREPICWLRELEDSFENLCSTEEHLLIIFYNSHYVIFQLLCQSRLGFHNQSRILISFNTFICMGLSLTVIILVLRTNVIDSAAACLQN